MNSATLAIILDGVPIGEIQRRGGERLEFRYDDNYRTSFDALPLSLCMPLSRRAHPDRWISPWLWGLLPDSEDVRKAWCKGTAASYDSAFEMLSTPIGYDCAGAVQFCKPDDVNWLAERGGDLEPLSEPRSRRAAACTGGRRDGMAGQVPPPAVQPRWRATKDRPALR